MTSQRPRPALPGPALIATPAAARAAWAAHVSANRAQVERLREEAESDDFYAPLAAVFRADPARRADPVLNAILAFARPGDTWLDVGAGGGRYALGVARAVRRLIAVEPSAGMREVFRDVARQAGITNTDLRDERWPPAGDPPPVDVALITHVGYDIEAIGPFLDALEAAATRGCVAVLLERSPLAAFETLWPPVHGEPAAMLPALPELIALLLARGRMPEVRLLGDHIWGFDSRQEAEQAGLRRLWLAQGSAKHQRLRDALPAQLQPYDGGVRLRTPNRIGLVSWEST